MNNEETCSVTIVDYGMGNLKSVSNILRLLNVEHNVSNTQSDLEKSKLVILPGVGAFGSAMSNLRKLDLISTIRNIASDKEKSILGICLGMQLLANSSQELGAHKGLSLIDGEVTRIPANPEIKIPHVGWNEVQFLRQTDLMRDLPNKSDFYFDHSFCFASDENVTLAKTELSSEISVSAIIEAKNIIGCQFHPEKSHRSGIQLMMNAMARTGVLSVG